MCIRDRVIDEQYKEQVLKTEKGCEDHYLFVCKNSQKNLQPDRSLLDVLELNEEVNDIFSNQRLTGILGSIAYDSESLFTVAEDLSLIHISEPTRQAEISYAVFCLKKKK